MKYRIWDKVEKCYFEPVYQAHEGNTSEIFLTPSGDLMWFRNGTKIHESAFKGRFVVEFGIGQPDKKGKEMFEGDILHLSNRDNFGKVRVVFSQSAFRLVPLCDLFNTAQLLENTLPWFRHEVIGSHLENPELLGE